MSITKTASVAEGFARPYRVFVNARSAFKAFLKTLGWQPGERILLPAYIGWSAREGSGVFDPITELELPHAFYRMDHRLHIDLNDLQQRLQTGRVKLLVLIHYFGHVDPNYTEAVALARQHGAWVLEDEAHALFTDLIGGISGRLGDACLFSLHKMLPVQHGGMLLVAGRHRELLDRVACDAVQLPLPWDYDLFAIAERRRQNVEQLLNLLPPLADHIEPLWGRPVLGETAQTLPVLVKHVSRDELYNRLNAVGLGVVSLYHTLIAQIPKQEFPESHQLSRSILNLPIHQDTSPEDLVAFVEQLGLLVRSLPTVARGRNQVGQAFQADVSLESLTDTRRAPYENPTNAGSK